MLPDIAVIRSAVYARIGLLGNPSDGYFGKTLSLAIKNFHAEVRNVHLVCATAMHRPSVASHS